MKHHYLHTLPAALGLLLLASAGSARADDDKFADTEQNGPTTTVAVAGEYLSESGDDDNPLDFAGGSVEYIHTTEAGGGFRLGLTALNGTRNPEALNKVGTTLKTDATEIRLHALYTPATATWLALGVEYIHEQRDTTTYETYRHLVDRGPHGRPNWQWDGTYYTKETDSGSGSSNSLFLKSVLSGPTWHLFRGSRSSIALAPILDAEAGYIFGSDGADGSVGYIAAARVRFAYALGASTMFLEGGYRCRGTFESGSEMLSGEFARGGFSYRW